MDWIQILYSDVIPWLMERDAPSVRYWTLTKLLDRAENEDEVSKARRAIMERGSAVEILAHYGGDGRWEGEHSYYTHKYKSTHWQLLLLAELAANGEDERIVAACRRMIEEVGDEDRSKVWPCFHGNLIGYLHALGHAGDERVRKFEADLARAGAAGKWCCDINGDLSCAWGAARALWGFGKIPPDERDEAVQEAIESGVRFLGRFLFSYEQDRGLVGSLSGGERSRLQMALLMLSDANFLLLDEPTNNLDLPSVEVLEDALADFEGTVFVISHDRYFLDRVVDRVVELDEGTLTEYIGDYSDFWAAKGGA